MNNFLKHKLNSFKLLSFTLFFFTQIKIHVASESIYGQVKWIDLNGFDPNQQTPTGFEGSPMYTIKANKQAFDTDGPICGKYHPELKKSYVMVGSETEAYSQYVQILSFPRGTISWVAASKNHLPADILSCGGPGHIPCRALVGGRYVIPGRVREEGSCIITYFFNFRHVWDYEVPVVNFMARALGAWPASKGMLHYRTERSEKYNYTNGS